MKSHTVEIPIYYLFIISWYRVVAGMRVELWELEKEVL